MEPARSAIGGFVLTSANYKSAIELLKKRYGKKIAVQRALVNELLNAPTVFHEGDTRRLCSLCDFVETKYRALQALEVDEQELLQNCRPSAAGKIPDATRLRITRGKSPRLDARRHVERTPDRSVELDPATEEKVLKP